MRFPATSGFDSLPVVVGVSRHSWLGSTGGGGVWLLASPGCGPGCGSPPLLAGVRQPRRWPFLWGWPGGFLVVCVLVARRVRTWCPCWCVCRVFVVVAWVWLVSSVCGCVCVCVCVCGVWRLVSPAGAYRWCGCGCGWCVLWLVPRHSWRSFLSAIRRHSWLGFAACGWCSSPLLAEGPGCGSSPILAGVRSPRWCVVACHSPLRVLVAVPRHSWLEGPLVALVGGPVPLLAEGVGCGSPPLLAGVRLPRRWVFPWVGVSSVVCAWVAACVRGVCAGVCGLCLWCLWWWWCGYRCAFGVRLCVCVCACVVCWRRVVAGPCFLRLLLGLVGVLLVFAMVGPLPLLADVPVCDSPPLPAGFRCRWWCVLLATPG